MGVELQAFGELPKIIAGQDEHVPCGCELPPGGQAVGVFEATVVHSQLTGLSVHLFHEIFDIPPQVFGDGHGGIVGGNHGHAFEQILERNFASGLEKHLGSSRALRLAADLHRIRGTDPALTDRLVGEVKGENLGDRGGLQRVVGIMGQENPAGRHVHQDGRVDGKFQIDGGRHAG